MLKGLAKRKSDYIFRNMGTLFWLQKDWGDVCACFLVNTVLILCLLLSSIC